MTLYSFALTLHLLSVLAAAAASGMTLQSALRLRAAHDRADAQSALNEIRRAVRVFPVATLGLVATGAYMTQAVWAWNTPWILASVAGLVMISILGSRIEGGRMKILAEEIGRSGFTRNARNLARDKVAWSAKFGTITLLAAVVLEMTLKPGAIPAVGLLLLALAIAPLLGRRLARTEVLTDRPGSEPAAS